LEDESYIDDPVKVYLREMQKVPPLTREEEALCVQHVRAKDDQADYSGKTLIEANLHVVVSVAERYKNDRIHTLDLIQRGNEGLLEALQTFADSQQDNFSAHAMPFIERAIAQAVTKEHPAPVPRHREVSS